MPELKELRWAVNPLFDGERTISLSQTGGSCDVDGMTDHGLPVDHTGSGLFSESLVLGVPTG